MDREQSPADVAGQSLAETTRLSAVSPEEQSVVASVLGAEYGLLMAALGAAWAASLTRTSIFLGVLSAAGVALGFASQGSIDSAGFITLALVVLPLVLFLGVATFVRVVQVQRECVVYITGLNRIRHFFQERAPASRPYFVLPAYDDVAAIYRGIGTGMNRRQPRFRIVSLVVQSQGIVGIVTGAVAAALGGLAAAPVGAIAAWAVAIAAFLLTVGVLFLYWRRSLSELQNAIRPMFPTPPEEIEAPY